MNDDELRKMVEEQPIPDKLIRDIGRAPLLGEDDPINGYRSLGEMNKPLSPAQVMVVRYASHGLNNLETADALGWGYETVKTQMKTAMRKLRAKNRTHAVALALRAELIP